MDRWLIQNICRYTDILTLKLISSICKEWRDDIMLNVNYSMRLRAISKWKLDLDLISTCMADGATIENKFRAAELIFTKKGKQIFENISAYQDDQYLWQQYCKYKGVSLCIFTERKYRWPCDSFYAWISDSVNCSYLWRYSQNAWHYKYSPIFIMPPSSIKVTNSYESQLIEGVNAETIFAIYHLLRMGSDRIDLTLLTLIERQTFVRRIKSLINEWRRFQCHILH